MAGVLQKIPGYVLQDKIGMGIGRSQVGRQYVFRFVFHIRIMHNVRAGVSRHTCRLG